MELHTSTLAPFATTHSYRQTHVIGSTSSGQHHRPGPGPPALAHWFSDITEPSIASQLHITAAYFTACYTQHAHRPLPVWDNTPVFLVIQ